LSIQLALLQVAIPQGAKLLVRAVASHGPAAGFAMTALLRDWTIRATMPIGPTYEQQKAIPNERLQAGASGRHHRRNEGGPAEAVYS
jgi:hypothetical protein